MLIEIPPTARVPRLSPLAWLTACLLFTLFTGTAYAQRMQRQQKPSQPRAAQPADTPMTGEAQKVTIAPEIPPDAIEIKTTRVPLLPPKKTSPKKNPLGFLHLKIDAPPGTKQKKWLPGEFMLFLEDAKTGGFKGYLYIGRNEWEYWNRQHSSFVLKTYSQKVQPLKYKAKLTVTGQYQKLPSSFERCWADDEKTFNVVGGGDTVTFQLRPAKNPGKKCIFPKGVE